MQTSLPVVKELNTDVYAAEQMLLLVYIAARFVKRQSYFGNCHAAAGPHVMLSIHKTFRQLAL